MSRLRLALCIGLACGLAGGHGTDAAEPPAAPTVGYWHLWTDAKGVSHMTRCAFRSFELKSMSKPADPQWQARQPSAPTTVITTVQPPGWKGSWHEDPKVQWIIPLNGTWFIEAMDGHRVELPPGEVTLGEDQHTSGGRGHLSGNVGDGPVTLMVVQLDVPPTVDQPCHAR